MPRKKDLIPKVQDEVVEKVKKEKKVKDEPDNRVDMILSKLKELKNKKEPEIIYESETDDDDDVDFIIQPKVKDVKKPEPIPEPIVEPVKKKREYKPRPKKEPVPVTPMVPAYDYNMINTLQQENERLKAQMKYNSLSKLQNQSTFMKIKF